ncbi:dienelactone hydrolase family protein [Flexivirga meconopsidis]|uniref:dienelactone hydrolase family protein n=1 Tax=Flexivirga meconopsidis TaxID=2977121 RepID=UPI00223F0615
MEVVGGPAPGVFWAPSATDPSAPPPPVVLLGHGGSGHKLSARNLDLANRLAREGVASYAIDGPLHGERAAAPGSGDYQTRLARTGMDVVLDRMTGDWLTGLDLLAARGSIDPDRVGVVGLSMGARFGIPLAAALEQRLRCAVFGKFGLRAAPPSLAALDTPRRHAEAATRITAPVLLHVQQDDEIFPLEGQLALFECFGGSGKRAIQAAGRHATPIAESEIADWIKWLAREMLTP